MESGDVSTNSDIMRFDPNGIQGGSSPPKGFTRIGW